MPASRAAHYPHTGTAPHVRRNDRSTDAPCFLLFAGVAHLPPLGGLGDLVGTFDSEEAARKAFHELRVAGLSKGSWAQLAMIEVQSGVRPVCWFGTGAPGRAPHVLSASTEVREPLAVTRKRRWMERYRRDIL